MWALAIPVVLWGCGSHRESAQARLCLPRTRQHVARTLNLSTRRIAIAPSIGNNAMPQCSFTARLPGGRRFDMTVNVDTSPQPYMVLARTIEERSQGFSPTSAVPAPVAVMGLGLEASWLPDEHALMSTDGLRLVTVSLTWPGTRQAQKIQFATRISRFYLGRSRASLAKRSP